MKTIISSIIIINLFLVLSSCHLSTEEAIAYNDKIINEQIAIITEIDNLMLSYENYIPKKMDDALSTTKQRIDKAIKEISSIPDFKDKSEFKDAAIELFSSYKEIVDGEYSEIVRIYKLPQEHFSIREVDEVNRLGSQADIKMNAAIEKFKTAQKKFASKYNFKLIGE